MRLDTLCGYMTNFEGCELIHMVVCLDYNKIDIRYRIRYKIDIKYSKENWNT